jgi:uncharacterized protein YfaS (alpha-2-macroglobulin family)
MKKSTLSFSLSLIISAFLPAAELVIQPETLTPKSTLELRFDAPMIEKSRVGTDDKVSPLVIEPNVEGVFKWTSTRSGQYRFTKAPALGGKYSFSLRAGLKDASGQTVKMEDLGSAMAEHFRIVEGRRTYSGYGDTTGRKAQFILQFNDAVDVSVFASKAHFSSSGKNLPVNVRLATGKDLKQGYRNSIAATWEEQLAGIVPKPKPDETRSNAVVVESKEPLPLGHDWALMIDRTAANASATAELNEWGRFVWGSIIPLAAHEVMAVAHFERSHEIIVRFNKGFIKAGEKPEEAAKAIQPFVKVEPAVANMKLEAGYSNVTITGDFVLNEKYTVTIDPRLTGSDGLPMQAGFSKTVVLEPSQAYVSTSAYANSQLASGHGLFDIFAANYKEMTVRVKQLSGGELLKAHEMYSKFNDSRFDKEEIFKKHMAADGFEKYPGKVVYEKVFTNEQPLEKGTLHRLNWKEILGQTNAAPVFVEISATPQDGAPAGNVIARSIVEFTDIGLYLKDNKRDALVYAFSLKTGAPLAGVQLSLADNKRGLLHQGQTDASGLATIPSDSAYWVLAKNGADTTAMPFDYQARIGLYNFGFQTAWNSPWKPRHKTFLYSDRPVYKPGDTAHVRAISRILTGDDIALGTKPFTAEMILRDPRGRVAQTKKIIFSANGTWSDDIVLPDAQAGWYGLSLKFDDGKAKKADDADEDDNDGDGGDEVLQLRVDDYKPNTFEVAFDTANVQIKKDRITVPLNAHYYMGKALSTAKASWSASLAGDFIVPEAFAQYHFGDVPSWIHYGEDRDEDQPRDEDDEGPPSWGAHGELTLSDDGTAEIQLPPPPPHKASLPQTITVYADVTDVNQQTISATTEIKVPGADFAVGAKRSSWYGTAGKAMSLNFVAITPDGEAFTGAVGVDIKVERQEWNTVRVQSAGGAATPKNQAVLIEESKASLGLKSVNKNAASGTLDFTPKKGGTYFVTATAKDAQGRTVFTRMPFYVISNDGFPWAVEEGTRIDLQPDKTNVKPGEEVTLVVKTPFAGNAMVSVERNRVHRTFMQPISPENPVIKVPMMEEDAPNVFISVVVIRGADQSPQPDPMPEYRLGYVEVNVESNTRVLAVEVDSDKDTVKPGEELSIGALVTDAQGKPVEGAEVNLYAVDEGVLSLMAYQTPDPGGFFYVDSPLAIHNYTSLSNLLAEAEDKRERGNKGTIIGGGGDEESGDALRKNFVATPVWIGSVNTDKEGKVITKFIAPDSLTRYRIMAVALKGADRFGSGESAFVINKPLMVEPVVPRFAHVGDEILVKAVLHNTTKDSGSVELELKLDDTASLISEPRPYALTGLNNRTMTNDGKSERRIVQLKAGETAAFAFPVKFVKRGTSNWEWRAHTTKWSGDDQSDGLESKFEVTHPAPALREVHYFQLTNANAKDDLLKRINPQLLEADGDVTVNVSTSRMGEARDAIEHILHYPYGCVEQTTSSTLPWLALSKYEALFPDLIQKDKVHIAITKGRDRLLNMQTENGGLSYWPGGDTPLLWASAYGGFCLLKIKDWGVPVPQESIDSLMKWMSDELREKNLPNTNNTWDLSDAAFALYTLTKAGKPEPAYQTILYQRKDRLPEMARLFLGLSMCLSNAPEKQIMELLNTKPKRDTWEPYWLGSNTADGLRLLINTHIGNVAVANTTATELIKRRNGNGHWGTTFSNAWVLLGLSASERPMKEFTPMTVAAQWQQASQLSLPTPLSSASMTFKFSSKEKMVPLTLTLPDNRPLQVRVETKAWPDLKTFQPVSKGFAIQRKYQRLTQTGALEPAKDLRVGDLVVVTLDIDVRQPNRYLALEDPLPSVFEPVNPEFATQNQNKNAKAKDNAWFCDHRELRNDKALFFTDDPTERGTFELQYLARVIAEGDVIAPPARIEAMYQPDQYGLSAIDRVQTLPMTNNGGNVAEK